MYSAVIASHCSQTFEALEYKDGQCTHVVFFACSALIMLKCIVVLKFVKVIVIVMVLLLQNLAMFHI